MRYWARTAPLPPLSTLTFRPKEDGRSKRQTIATINGGEREGSAVVKRSGRAATETVRLEGNERGEGGRKSTDILEEDTTYTFRVEK